MNLQIEPYLYQKERWPSRGQVILAQYDADSVVVYQAYRPMTGHFAAKHGYFGEGFSLNRMTWIKPNFLWMMYRSGWGTKEGQEVTLAIRIHRFAFDFMLAQAVHSQYVPALYETESAWSRAIQRSEVRLQWDPDHTPAGGRLKRRALQLGLQREAIKKYAREWILNIEDISAFVAEQRQHVVTNHYDSLLTPSESVYKVINPEIIKNLQLSELEESSNSETR